MADDLTNGSCLWLVRSSSPQHFVLFLTACGGGSGSTGGGTGGGGGTTPPPSTANEWTWVSGGNSSATAGAVYGTQGVAAASNTPGARLSAAGWTDSSGNLWLFGGSGYVNSTTVGDLNDLWEFNITTKEWTWVSGENTVNNQGTWGTQGVASTSYVPGGLEGAVGWTDSTGDLWLFGGGGHGDSSDGDGLNDLWEFNPATKAWTWVSGSNTAKPPGVYGTQGVAATGNTPGGRAYATAWTDSSGNFWLFGGYGKDSTGTFSYLNDLWEFSPTTKEWTSIGGSNTANAQGVYGTQGVAAASDVPGAREDAVSWTDSSGKFWLFGGSNGSGNSGGAGGLLNDLWEFNPSTKEWTWVSGSNAINAAGIYGTQGAAAPSNVPGAREYAVGWRDSSGNLWLYGGEGFVSTTVGGLGDLWEFSPTTKQWTWVGGLNVLTPPAVFGTEGTAATGNTPGYMEGAFSWTDNSDNFWLFGGGSASLNGLWRYQP